jgi:hypothetical protein
VNSLKIGSNNMLLGLPLSSPKGLSFLSKRKPQRSTSGIGKLGYFNSEGILMKRSSSCRRVVVFKEDARGCRDKAHEISQQSSEPSCRVAASQGMEDSLRSDNVSAVASPHSQNGRGSFPTRDGARPHRGHQEVTLVACSERVVRAFIIKF